MYAHHCNISDCIYSNLMKHWAFSLFKSKDILLKLKFFLFMDYVSYLETCFCLIFFTTILNCDNCFVISAYFPLLVSLG